MSYDLLPSMQSEAASLAELFATRRHTQRLVEPETTERLLRVLNFTANLTEAEITQSASDRADEATFQPHDAKNTRVAFLFDSELLARVEVVGCGEAFQDLGHAGLVMAHLLRIGLEQMEDQLNTEQDELF